MQTTLQVICLHCREITELLYNLAVLSSLGILINVQVIHDILRMPQDAADTKIH